MEKVFWVVSNQKMIGAKANDGLDEVNSHLQNGWTVKYIKACAAGVNLSQGQAYIVLEKKD